MADSPIDRNRANKDPKGTRPGKMREHWASMTEDERLARSAAFRAASRSRWEAWPEEKRRDWIEKTAAGRRTSEAHPRAIAISKYRKAGLPDEEVAYLLTLAPADRKMARLRQRDYGISPLQYRALLEQQDGRCALCDVLMDRKNCHLDHDHVGGAVRGLLCARCNLSLGHLEARGAEWIARAFRYIATKQGREAA